MIDLLANGDAVLWKDVLSLVIAAILTWWVNHSNAVARHANEKAVSAEDKARAAAATAIQVKDDMGVSTTALDDKLKGLAVSAAATERMGKINHTLLNSGVLKILGETRDAREEIANLTIGKESHADNVEKFEEAKKDYDAHAANQQTSDEKHGPIIADENHVDL